MSKTVLVLVVFVIAAIAAIIIFLKRRKNKILNENREDLKEDLIIDKEGKKELEKVERLVKEKLDGGYNGLLNAINGGQKNMIDSTLAQFAKLIPVVDQVHNDASLTDVECQELYDAIVANTDFNNPPRVFTHIAGSRYQGNAVNYLLKVAGNDIWEGEADLSNASLPVLEFNGLMFALGSTHEFVKFLGSGGYNIATMVKLGNGKEYCLRTAKHVTHSHDTIFEMIEQFNELKNKYYDKVGSVDHISSNPEVYKCKVDFLPEVYFSTLDFTSLPLDRTKEPSFFIIEPILAPIDLQAKISEDYANKYIKAISKATAELAKNGFYYMDYKYFNFMETFDGSNIILSDIDFVSLKDHPDAGTAVIVDYAKATRGLTYDKINVGPTASTYKTITDDIFSNFYCYTGVCIPGYSNGYLINETAFKISCLSYLFAEIINVINYNNRHAARIAAGGNPADEDVENLYCDNFRNFGYLYEINCMIENPTEDVIRQICNIDHGMLVTDETIASIVEAVNGFGFDMTEYNTVISNAGLIDKKIFIRPSMSTVPFRGGGKRKVKPGDYVAKPLIPDCDSGFKDKIFN